jgi:hypothetical protein
MILLVQQRKRINILKAESNMLHNLALNLHNEYLSMESNNRDKEFIPDLVQGGRDNPPNKRSNGDRKIKLPLD